MHRSRRDKPRPGVPEAKGEHTVLRRSRCWSCGSVPLRCQGERPGTIAVSIAILATVTLRRSLANAEERYGAVDVRHADGFGTG
jgi:hypothetical protein